MLSIFRTNQLLVGVLLIFYIGMLRAVGYLLPAGGWSPHSPGPISEGLYGLVGTTGFWPWLMALLLVFLQANLINITVANYRMSPEVNLFPGIVYALLSSCVADFQFLSPILVANTFYIWAVYILFDVYKKSDAAPAIFNVGFWLGVAALCYYPFVTFIIVGFFGLNTLRAFKVRELLIMASGLFTPFLLAGYYAIWQGTGAAFLQSFRAAFAYLDFAAAPQYHWMLTLGLWSLLLVIVLFSYTSYLKRVQIEAKKQINILYWGLLVSGLTIPLLSQADIENLLVSTVPLAILLNFSFSRLSGRNAEALHFVLLAAVLFWQYQFLFLD